tara:strand:- start:1043 stop:1465 length:423 start_codon:yes stop_codon:yes gene_type:complete
MDTKNHEQYLEQIELAVQETTRDLLSKHNGDLRAMAKVCAEKQVEINRLKENQTNDRNTIKQLRYLFQEADDERNIYKEESEFGLYQYRKVKEELEELVEKLNKFCKRGRVAEKNSELEDLYLREAGLIFNDDDKLELRK